MRFGGRLCSKGIVFFKTSSSKGNRNVCQLLEIIVIHDDLQKLNEIILATFERCIILREVQGLWYLCIAQLQIRYTKHIGPRTSRCGGPQLCDNILLQG